MEKAKARGKEYHPDISNKNLLLPLSKEYLAHVLSALTSAYALGKSEKFIRSILLEPLTEATMNEYKYRKNHKADLLIIISAFILLNLDKRDFGKFTDKLKENGSATDTLIRSRLTEWEMSEQSVFPEWKSRIIQQPGGMVTTEPGDFPNNCQLIIRDAILLYPSAPSCGWADCLGSSLSEECREQVPHSPKAPCLHFS